MFHRLDIMLKIQILLLTIFVINFAQSNPAQQYHRNQRIIKVVQPSHRIHKPHGPVIRQNHHSHHHEKHYDYIKPRQPPPQPPFGNYHHSSHGNNVKHYPMPPPHSHVKIQNGNRAYHSGPPSSQNAFQPIPTNSRPPSFSVSSPIKYKTSKPIVSIPIPPPSSPHYHQAISDNRGPIHEIPAPNLGPKPSNSEHIFDEPIYKKPIEIKYSPSYGGKTSSYSHAKDPHSHIPGEPVHSYEVTESVSSNDHIIEQEDGSKSYYAPDPDPSLPTHKIPPTTDPHSLPSNGKQQEFYIPQHGQEALQVLDGGTVSAPVNMLSTQELFNLIHGFPADFQQPIHNAEYQQNIRFVPQPQANIHVLTPQEAERYQHEYQSSDIRPQYQSFNYEENNPNAAAVPMENYHSSNHQYEPETSESHPGPIIIRQTNHHEEEEDEEESTKMFDDISSNIIENDFEQDKDQSPIFEMKGESEIPFYSSLPNRQAAEALASLQAAGSIATNFMTNGKTTKEETEETSKEGRKMMLTEHQSPRAQKVIQVSNLTHDGMASRPLPMVEKPKSSSMASYSKSTTPKQTTEVVFPLEKQETEKIYGESSYNENFGKKLRSKSVK